MRLCFWGTRGSIPVPGYGTVRFGGNTCCVELRSEAGTLIVLDCGSGAHVLGANLVDQTAGPLAGHILITHTHWDHIQGFPFFKPLFMPDGSWDIYGPSGLGQSLKEALAGQMQYTYFPVTLDQLGATQRYHELVEGVFDIGDVHVTTRFLNHPALTLGYRLEVDGVVVVYATDHEPHSSLLAPGFEGWPPGEDGRHADFLAGADLLIHDAQYTAEEYPAKMGWGHSTVEYVVDMARVAGVRRLALFHHDPWRDDAAVDRLVAAARRHVSAAGDAVEVFGAAEGNVFDLTGAGIRTAAGMFPASGVLPASDALNGAAMPSESPSTPALRQQRVVVAVTESGAAQILSEAVRANGFELLTATDGAAALELAQSRSPSLVVLDRALPKLDSLEVCRQIRQDGDASGNGATRNALPVVLVADTEAAADRDEAEAAGVTDWLIRPFTAAYARSRMRAWVLRTAHRWRPAEIPSNEVERLAALRRLELEESRREERFDRITRMASSLLDMPISALTLIDADRQWFKSTYGSAASHAPRDVAFCAHTILGDDVLVVPDAMLDDRFADNPSVAMAPRIRFYAGAPLRTTDGYAVGSLCVLDHRPRHLNDEGLALLRDLAALAEEELRHRSEG